MQFITNRTQPNHLQVVQQMLDEAEEVFIAVAFLKMSGLSHFEKQLRQLAKDKVPVTLVVGLNFAITEPAALQRLYSLRKRHQNFALYLGRYDAKSQTFHPKIYASRKAKRFQLLSGSANLTNGGLGANHEASVFLEGNVQAEVWKNVLAHFEFLSSYLVSEPISKGLLEEYMAFYSKAKKHRVNGDYEFDSAPKHIDDETEELSKLLTKERRKELSIEFARREALYEKARLVLASLSSEKKTSKERFIDHLNQLIRTKGKKEPYFQSGSLHRQRPKLLDNPEGLIEIIKAAFKNKDESPRFAFDELMDLARGYNGIGVNLVTEILMAINPATFANINKKPIEVICSISGSDLKKTYQTYNGADYQRYCDTVKKINERLDFSNFIQSDAFFNESYNKLKSDSKNSKVGSKKKRTSKSGLKLK